MENKLINILREFTKSDAFVDGIVSSTKAGWGGSAYVVEVFENGDWRVLWENSVGNLYRSKGLIARIPQLTPEQCEEADEDNVSLKDVARFYQEELAGEFLDHHNEN